MVGVSSSEFIFGPNFVEEVAVTKINTNRKKAIPSRLHNY